MGGVGSDREGQRGSGEGKRSLEGGQGRAGHAEGAEDGDGDDGLGGGGELLRTSKHTILSVCLFPSLLDSQTIDTEQKEERKKTK